MFRLWWSSLSLPDSCLGATLVNQRMSLTISTTTNCELQHYMMILYVLLLMDRRVRQLYMLHDDNSFAQKSLGSTNS